MSKEASEDRLESAPAERRRTRRKRVLLSGVVADANGKNAIDCIIRDLTARGAQVQLSVTLRKDNEVYLVDTRNEIAHLATVAWVKAGRAGLSFVRSYTLESALPPPLEFLGRLLIEAKVRQVHTLIKRGVPVEDATLAIGLSEDHIERFRVGGGVEAKADLLFHQVKQLFGK
jgi:hypothetical protein